MGCGWFVTREQFWSLDADSYMLLPGEKRTVSLTESSGMEHTTSSQESVAESLGVSASGGWGPISASVSSSLSSTSSTSDQLTIKSQETRYVSVELNNKTDKDMMYLRWNLMDVITIYSCDGDDFSPSSAISSKISPAILEEFDIGELK
jgi:hypothetical protein